MIILADARQLPLADTCVQCCVTSPPYWGLRDYGVSGQLGQEKTTAEYVANMVQVFREVRRVLKADGTLWLNLGDSYAGYHGNSRVPDCEAPSNKPGYIENMHETTVAVENLKSKDLVGIPWRVAFALQADGWYLRSDIIWAKPNPMPESVTDRPTKAHEYIFLLTKSERYYFDSDAVKELCAETSYARWNQNVDAQHGSDRVPGKTNGTMKAVGGPRSHKGSKFNTGKTAIHQMNRASDAPRESINQDGPEYRNVRTIWNIATQPYKGSHFATFPEAIPERCIKAGSRVGDLVLDPFGGSGTTGRVAERLNRKWVHIDLNYHQLAAQRVSHVQKQLIAI